MTIYSVYDQIAEMIARLDPTQVIALKASKEMQLRLDLLIDKSKSGAISKAEQDELYHYLVLERLIRLAKLNVKLNQKSR